MHITPSSALQKLSTSEKEFLTLFNHGTLEVEIYKPDQTDKQTPHTRDEVYIVVSGTGEFFNDGQTTQFNPGDFLFVKAGKEHRFLNFTDDFSTWVIFYGPEGGENE